MASSIFFRSSLKKKLYADKGRRGQSLGFFLLFFLVVFLLSSPVAVGLSKLPDFDGSSPLCMGESGASEREAALFELVFTVMIVPVNMDVEDGLTEDPGVFVGAGTGMCPP
jgi:hypothetical protein